MCVGCSLLKLDSMPVHFLRSGTTAVVGSLKEPVIQEELLTGFHKPIACISWSVDMFQSFQVPLNKMLVTANI